MTRTTSALLSLAAACLVGAAVHSAWGQVPEPAAALLAKADRFELLSLNPNPLEKATPDSFHGYKVLGATEVKDAATRKKLLAALDKGVKEHDGGVAGCFHPRHGIRATQGKKTLDLVICFECVQVREYLDGKEGRGFLVSGSPAAVFSAVLKDAKVPLPKD